MFRSRRDDYDWIGMPLTLTHYTEVYTFITHSPTDSEALLLAQLVIIMFCSVLLSFRFVIFTVDQ